MKEKVYYVGLTLIVISFIACVISFYLLVFGIPMFLVGGVLVLFSNQATKVKLLVTIGPPLLYFPLTFLFLYLYNYSTPKTILIPKDFDGYLRVVYEEKCGNNYDEKDGIKILTFPKNGILVLNEDFDSHVNYNYYLVDEFGNRTEMQQGLARDRIKKKRPYVVVGGSGTIGRGITISDFYVYNKDSVERNDFKSEQDFDLLTVKIVNQCRGNE